MIAKKVFFIIFLFYFFQYGKEFELFQILTIFFQICKRKEFKLFQLLEIFFKNVLMHRPVAKDRP